MEKVEEHWSKTPKTACSIATILWRISNVILVGSLKGGGCWRRWIVEVPMNVVVIAILAARCDVVEEGQSYFSHNIVDNGLWPSSILLASQ